MKMSKTRTVLLSAGLALKYYCGYFMGMLVKVFESLSQYSYLRLVYGLFNNAA
jgi:hypothetical protein